MYVFKSSAQGKIFPLVHFHSKPGFVGQKCREHVLDGGDRKHFLVEETLSFAGARRERFPHTVHLLLRRHRGLLRPLACYLALGGWVAAGELRGFDRGSVNVFINSYIPWVYNGKVSFCVTPSKSCAVQQI